MGRPLGVKNGEGEKPLMPIKKWTARDEMVLYLHLHNYDGIYIAEQVRLTPGRVSQILNDPYAQERIAEIKRRMKLALVGNIEGRLLNLGDNALKRIEHTINREDLDLVLHPEMKKHQDRLSFDVLTRLGVLGKEEGGDPRAGESAVPGLNDSLMKRLTYALEKSNEAEAVRRGDGGKVIEAEVVVEIEEKEVKGD